MLKRLLGWLIPYLNEARFYNSIKKFGQDKSTLGAQIRKTAHALEKNLTALGKPCNASMEKKIEKLLEEWKSKGFENNDKSIKWAEKILEKHRKKSAKLKVGIGK